MVDDALSKVLGPNLDHVRGFGFGVTRSKLSILSQQDQMYKVFEKEYLKMKEEMVEMKVMKDKMIEMKALTSSYLKKQILFSFINLDSFSIVVLNYIFGFI